MARILWITPKWPLPAQDGQRIATVKILEKVARLHSTDLLSFVLPDDRVDPDEAQKLLGLSKIHILPTRARGIGPKELGLALRGLFPGQVEPLVISRFLDSTLIRKASVWMSENAPWDYAVLDTLHSAGAFLENGSLKRPRGVSKIIYRAHNVEALLWHQEAEKGGNPLRRLAFRSQARRMSEFESRVLEFSDCIFPVSNDDLKALRERSPRARYECIPIGLDFPPAPLPAPALLSLLFLGRLDWPPNREGLKWFLNEVWRDTLTRRKELTLTIAGSGESSWLAPYRDFPGVRILGRVDDVSALYRESSAALVPLFSGSGTRVKAIEAASFGRPCVSTALGVQGLGLEASRSYFQAETRDQWISLLGQRLTTDSCAEVGARAFSELKPTFDSAFCAERFTQALEKC